MGGPVYGENGSRMEERHMANLKPWMTKFMKIEWGRAFWTARSGMICGERR